MKKVIAVLVSSIFALSLGVVYAQEDNTPKNPWEMNQPGAPAKKESKTKKKEKKTGKEKIKKANKETGKKKKS